MDIFKCTTFHGVTADHTQGNGRKYYTNEQKRCVCTCRYITLTSLPMFYAEEIYTRLSTSFFCGNCASVQIQCQVSQNPKVNSVSKCYYEKYIITIIVQEVEGITITPLGSTAIGISCSTTHAYYFLVPCSYIMDHLVEIRREYDV